MVLPSEGAVEEMVVSFVSGSAMLRFEANVE